MQRKEIADLTTDRLILRRWRIEDAEDMFRNWAQSEAVTRYLTWAPHTAVEETRYYIQSVIDSYPDGRYDWVIEWKETHEAIGAIGVNELREDLACGEIGYCLSERFWGMGIMPEAFGEVIRFLFEEVGLNRIQATHDPRNAKSGRVMEKCGLKYEGTMRQSSRNNQGVCDEVMRAILKEDYFKNQV